MSAIDPIQKGFAGEWSLCVDSMCHNLKNETLTKSLFYLCVLLSDGFISDDTPVGTTKKHVKQIPVSVYVATGPLFEIVT